MKKVITIICTIIIALGVVSGACSEWVTWKDIADMLSDQELQEVAIFMQSEAINRLGQGFDLDAGIYLVGGDIPAGRWSIEMKASASAEVIVYADDAFFKNSLEMPIFDQLLHSATTTRIGQLILTEGSYVEIKGSVHFSPFVGLM